MNQIYGRVTTLFKKKSVKYGVPFILVIVGGSFGLKEFAKLRYEFSRVSPVKKEAKKLGINMVEQSDITLEKQYEKLKDLNIDNWEQVRGPRPWEESFEEEK